MNSNALCPSFKMLLFLFCFFVCFSVFHCPIYAQENPPKPFDVKVNVGVAQYLDFGRFCYSTSSGTVSIDPNSDARTSLNIILISSNPQPHAAIFEVQAIENTLITIVNGPDVSLGGTGGGSMNLHIGASDHGSSFIAQGKSLEIDKMVTTYVKIGGTLNVGTSGANPPGNYIGTFTVTFIQQ